MLRLAIALLLAALTATAGRAQPVALEDPFPNLTFSAPVELMDAGDGTDYLYVAEQSGRIKVFENDPGVAEADVFLDLTDRVYYGGEMGLLGLAFDPDYADNGYLYVDYVLQDPRRTRISRFTRSATSPPAGDPDSEVVLLEVEQPYSNHNAGAIAFGPPEGPGGERYLYVTLGDGGSGGDPDENGQDPSTLLGSILRLDVHGGGDPLDCGAGTGTATVPPDNPFLGVPDHCDEIYAYGFRNPWRMRFDEAGDWSLWVGDVGQSAREEINVIEAGSNHGWAAYEGTSCFEGPCDPTGKTFPVYEYAHAPDRFAIIGGYVYRGAAISWLTGKYVYGDLSGLVFALDISGATPVNELLLDFGDAGVCSGSYCLASMGEDAAGELYLLANSRGTRKLVPVVPIAAETASVPSRIEGVYPNPFRERATVRLDAGTGQPVQVALYDALGRQVLVLHDGPLPADGAVTLDGAGLPSGVYLVRVVGEGQRDARRVVLMR